MVVFHSLGGIEAVIPLTAKLIVSLSRALSLTRTLRITLIILSPERNSRVTDHQCAHNSSVYT